MQPNRLECVWAQVKPEILEKWDRLAESDLDSCEYKYDLIIEAIRKIYYPGRSHLSLEGDIRDWLNERVRTHEDRKENLH